MSRRFTWPFVAALLCTPVLIVLLLDLGLSRLIPVTVAGKLLRPDPARVYVLGNSMFRTALDLESCRRLLPRSSGLDFEKHEGHYTNFWYLAIKNALIPARQHPRMVVWGFRPTYARFPAFRRRKICDIETFLSDREPTYHSVIARVTSEKRKPSFSAQLYHFAGKQSYLFGSRESLRNRLMKRLNRAGLSVLRLFRPANDLYLQQLSQPNLTVADHLVRALTRGRVGLLQESVVDAGKQFIRGRPAKFSHSFVPLIAELLTNAQIPQLVVIFKPATHNGRGLDRASSDFTREAVEFFKRNRIPFINLLDEARLQPKHFAKGDHYNTRGRALTTPIICGKIRRLLQER